MNIYPKVYFDGAVRPKEEAKISLASNSLQYGVTCFAGIKGYVKEGEIRIFRLQDHAKRLLTATKILGMEVDITEESICQAVLEVVLANPVKENVYIRPFVFTPDEVIAPKPCGQKFQLAIYLLPMDHLYDPTRGLRLMVSSWRKFSDAAIPTKAKAGGCYINSFLATGDALRAGYDEALLMDHSGNVVEASVANILLSYRGRLIVPQVGEAQLDGITMRSVVEILELDGLKVSFEKVDRSMVYSCDELLLTGTAAQVMFAESVDGREIGNKGPGEICIKLQKAFLEIINNCHPKSDTWLTNREIKS